MNEEKERDTITEYEWQDFVLALPLTMRPRFALLKEMHERLLQAPSFWEGESDRLNKELCEKDVEIHKLKEELTTLRTENVFLRRKLEEEKRG